MKTMFGSHDTFILKSPGTCSWIMEGRMEERWRGRKWTKKSCDAFLYWMACWMKCRFSPIYSLSPSILFHWRIPPSRSYRSDEIVASSTKSHSPPSLSFPALSHTQCATVLRHQTPPCETKAHSSSQNVRTNSCRLGAMRMAYGYISLGVAEPQMDVGAFAIWGGRADRAGRGLVLSG